MSVSLADAVPEATRKAVHAAAVAAAPSPAAEAAAAQAALQEHFARGIKAWCSCAQEDAGATESEFSLDESLIDSSVLTQWEGELQAKGYVVTRANGRFTIALTA